MQQGTFNITALENAEKRLQEMLARYNKEHEDEAVRDSVIQRFEFTYSIALKTLRKYFIERAFVLEEVNQMSFNEMIRTASQLNLLVSNLEKWAVYREMRNMTSHTYDEEIALQVVSIIPDFSKEIAYLITRLKESN